MFDKGLGPHMMVIYFSTEWGREEATAIFQINFLVCYILIQNSLKFVPKGTVDKKQQIAQILALWRTCNRPIYVKVIFTLATVFASNHTMVFVSLNHFSTSSWKTKTCLSLMTNTVAVDDMATQRHLHWYGNAMTLTFSWNISVSMVLLPDT